MENIKAVLESQGLNMEDVVKSMVFLKNINDFGRFNEVYATYFRSAPPARSTVEVSRMAKDADIEIEMIAMVRD
jgi:2-iminobutanoate/2-iminopropanoate deaminase